MTLLRTCRCTRRGSKAFAHPLNLTIPISRVVIPISFSKGATPLKSLIGQPVLQLVNLEIDSRASAPASHLKAGARALPAERSQAPDGAYPLVIDRKGIWFITS